MRTIALRFIFTVALLATPAAASAQGNNNQGILHALIFGDSLADGIGQGGVVDTETMTAALRHGIPEDRCKITILKGSEATKTAVLQYYQNLNVGPNDVLFFHYAGHGGMYFKPKKEHVLTLHSGGWLPRSELRAMMLAKKPALAVILTDCCSDEIKDARKHKGKPLPEVRTPRSKVLLPGYAQLFFQTRGVVEITGADDGKSAIGDPVNGGVFTRAFHDALVADSQNGNINWPVFYGKLKDKTTDTYKRIGYTGPAQTSRAIQLPGASWGFVATEENGTIQITEVHLLSPAEQAGLQTMDVVLKVDGVPVKSNPEFIAAMSKITGNTVELTVRLANNQVVPRKLKRG